jgi:hypothetical protein
MKPFIFIVAFTIFSNNIFAQKLAKVTISNNGTTESLSIALDENVLINLTADGNLINYGIEYFSERITNYSRMESYNGRTELYSNYDDKAFQGKLKYIGRTLISYYASYDAETLRGKIKSIGNLTISYFMPFEDETLRGKIKSIGSNSIAFFTSFDNIALRGKIRSIGSTQLNYYSSFDDAAFKGRIKSIGTASFTYYSSFDKIYAGAMKTGSQQQNINGIMYTIR